MRPAKIQVGTRDHLIGHARAIFAVAFKVERLHIQPVRGHAQRRHFPRNQVGGMERGRPIER